MRRLWAVTRHTACYPHTACACRLSEAAAVGATSVHLRTPCTGDQNAGIGIVIASAAPPVSLQVRSSRSSSPTASTARSWSRRRLHHPQFHPPCRPLCPHLWSRRLQLQLRRAPGPRLQRSHRQPSPAAPPKGPGPVAGAEGTPGGTSTSTSSNAAAAASGPPGEAHRLTHAAGASCVS